ncbi:hypothetical protein [Qipengyuania huizhouensis]|uniref:hypothetical protein n=1 Tax=Qipengyuania huizhouensis TaxID=2867245 RepID=UPI001C88849D|nr:hypothetical protein [Qipengyuania huizhouensis]MBX7460821.1 hypothetical protein [Qipengyuania huizhouensis]
MKRYPTIEEKRAHCLQRMKQAEAAMEGRARFRPQANNMAAGPCQGCLAIEKHTYRADKAPLMPLDECPHPDQCVGHYRLEVDY